MFERNVRVRGTVQPFHEVVGIAHDTEGTTLTVHSYETDERGQYIETWATVPLALGIDFEQAERLVMELPEYAEATPEQSLVDRMRAVLTPEQLAELGLEG